MNLSDAKEMPAPRWAGMACVVDALVLSATTEESALSVTLNVLCIVSVCR